MKFFRQILFFIVLAGLLYVASAFRHVPFISKASKALTNDSLKADTVIKRAYSVMGTPYKWAGATPQSGFDCSGFVYWCFKPTGISIPRSSKGLYDLGTPITVEEAQRGDVILFRGTDPNDKSVGHVGIVVSKKGEPLKFVHSSSSKQHWGVVETEYGGSYYIKRFVGIRRVL